MLLGNILAQVAPVEIPDSVPTPKQELEMLKSLPLDELIDMVVRKMVTFTIDLVIAVIVFVVGKYIISKLLDLLRSIMVRRKVDRSLTNFSISFVKIALYFTLIVIVVGILGIETSSFLALFASAGVAVGMALSGTLQNFAGGVLILLLKPYKLGDYIEAQGYAGSVKEIQIFHTVINTPDNKSILIPNGGLSTGSINNYSREEYRRLDWTISISYGDKVDAARKAMLAICNADERIVKMYIEDDQEMRKAGLSSPSQYAHAMEMCRPSATVPWTQRGWWHRLWHKPEPGDKPEDLKADKDERRRMLAPKVDRSARVYVSQLADSSVNLTLRAWTRNEYYWDVFFSINERIYNELPLHGINFPFPQMQVHMSQPESEASQSAVTAPDAPALSAPAYDTQRAEGEPQ